MNKTVPFGYHGFGSHTLIKLNMNLTPEDAAAISKEYGFNVTYCNSRKNPHLYRIEGVVHWNTWASEKYIMWFEKLKVYQINAKMHKLACQKQILLDSALGMDNYIQLVDLDLPF
jgi:hypothetical protein